MNRLFFVLYFVCHLSYGQNFDFKTINFKKADSIALVHKNHNLNSLPLLAHKLTTNLDTDLQKFRAIFKWVCIAIENDYDGANRVNSKRTKFSNDSIKLIEWNKDYNIKIFKTLLKERKTICTGYAYLIKELAVLAGLECQIIDGYGRSALVNIGKLNLPNHSWNAVKIDGHWQLCDATWSSGYYILGPDTFVFDFSEAYFLSNPKLFIKDHYPLDRKWAMVENIPSHSEFTNAPLQYKETYRFGILSISPSEMNFKTIKKTVNTILIQSTEPLLQANTTIELVSRSLKKEITPSVYQKSEGFYELKYSIPFSGTYDIHLKIDNLVVLTYIANVSRKK